MHKIAMATLCVLTLAGCATTAPYGNFANNSTATDQMMASDSVRQIVSLYPPAKTRFKLKHQTPDIFGATLIRRLREQGYAIVEFDPKEAKPHALATDHHSETPDTPTTVLLLRYVLDHADGSNLYRLTIMIGTQSISRPYIEQTGTIVSAGYWVRKE